MNVVWNCCSVCMLCYDVHKIYGKTCRQYKLIFRAVCTPVVRGSVNALLHCRLIAFYFSNGALNDTPVLLLIQPRVILQ